MGFAIGLFFYQTLDAIDGKQARRTGSSSPLGQLFDHGCDANSAVFVALAMCAAARLGYDYWSYGLVCAILIPFYLGQLLEHNIGIVRTHVGGMGVTEGQDA